MEIYGDQTYLKARGQRICVKGYQLSGVSKNVQEVLR